MNQAALASRDDNRRPSGIAEHLARDYAALEQAIAALAAKADEAPKKIDSDDVCNSVSDLVKEVAAAVKRTEAARVAEKEPHLQASREVDGFFKKLKDRADRMQSVLQERVTLFLRAKADKERREREAREAVERAAADEARRKAAEAEAAGRAKTAEKHLAKAEAAEQRADDAAIEAAQKPAEFARTRSDIGTMATLRETWEFEIVDIDTIPLDQLKPYLSRADLEKAIRKFVGVGKRELPGVRIFKQQHAVVR